jgi:hypothetical protein
MSPPRFFGTGRPNRSGDGRAAQEGTERGEGKPMGKKPLITLAGLFLAGVAIGTTGCGQCTQCNTRPGKFTSTAPQAKAPTPAIGDTKKGGELARDMGKQPKAPPVTDILPVGGFEKMPPPPTAAQLSRQVEPLPGPGPMNPPPSTLPGREPIESTTTSRMDRLDVPPPPVRPNRTDGFTATPVSNPTEAARNTSPPVPTNGANPTPLPPVPATPVENPPTIAEGMPMTPPAAMSPAPVGDALPGIAPPPGLNPPGETTTANRMPSPPAIPAVPPPSPAPETKPEPAPSSPTKPEPIAPPPQSLSEAPGSGPPNIPGVELPPIDD